MSREVMQQALEALETVFMPHHPAVISLRERLAQPEQESAAWHGWLLREVLFENGEPIGHREPKQEPRQWQGLTDEEIKIIHNKNYNYEELARAVEDKLKEKNI